MARYVGRHKPLERLAAIIHYRVNEHCIRTMMELLYALRGGSTDELALYARDPDSNPYRVTKDENGFTCGHNPFLYGRLVDKLVVERVEQPGVEVISWIERPRRQLVDREKDSGPRIAETVPAQPDKIERKSAVPLWRIGSVAG